ncbi:FtsH protease activity modulator HflK [bacterium]|nr:FtsH protease activity modulator HflK [bacterium]
MPDNPNPWGNKGKKPNELDELIQQGLKKLFGMKQDRPRSIDPDGKPKPPGGKNFGFIIAILVIVFIVFQSFYQVNPSEKGVVLRFGKFNNVTEPGLHFLIPFIEKVIKVDVDTIRKEEFGFRQNIPRGYTQAANSLDLEALMITADTNVIQLNWVVQYRIRDAEYFVFNIKDTTAAVRDISESVIRRLVGNRDFDYVLNNRAELAQSTLEEMQELLDKYLSGIQLVVVQLQDLNPPDPVRPSFNEVNQADQDKIRLGNEAQKEANTRIPKARGTARKAIEEAQGYRIERINRAEGDVARFNAIYSEYAKAKQVTKTRMYVETLRAALPNAKDIVVYDQGQKGMIPLLNLGDAISGTRPVK